MDRKNIFLGVSKYHEQFLKKETNLKKKKKKKIKKKSKSKKFGKLKNLVILVMNNF